MIETIDVPAEFTARLDGPERAVALASLRDRLATRYDALEGWTSSVSERLGSVTFNRGLAEGFSLQLTSETAATPTTGGARVRVEVSPDTRLGGVVGVPAFFALFVGGVVFVIVAGEPVLGAVARWLKKFIFGVVLVAALLLSFGVVALVERLLTAGRGNPYAQADAQRAVVDAVRDALAARRSID